MSITAEGWKNKGGTSARSCKCGNWAQHWVNHSGKSWPAECSVSGCSSKATLGAHVINRSVAGERIAPMCGSCNGLTGSFTLKGGVTLPSASPAETCGA
jgi:hypothetical protein